MAKGNVQISCCSQFCYSHVVQANIAVFKAKNFPPRNTEGTEIRRKNLLKRLMIFLGTTIFFLIIIFATLSYINRPGDPLAARPAHHLENGFRNPWPAFENRGLSDVLRWQVDRWRGKAPKKPPRYNFQIAANDGQYLRANREAFTVTWIGHAATLVQIEGRNILTDPNFSERCSPVSWAGPKRAVPPSPSFEHLPPIDFVLISHNHYDHFDELTIKRLGNRPRYFVPLRVGRLLRDFGIEQTRITELDWWQAAEFEGLQFHCTPTQHFSGRGLHDRNQTLWCSWAVMGKQQRFYFGGDSGYFPGFKEIGEKFGPFDLAILPIGAYLPRWFMAPIHVDPAESAQAFLDLRAEKLLAIHWGTFDLADEPMDEPPKRLRAAVDSLGINPAWVWTFQPGETRTVTQSARLESFGAFPPLGRK